MGKKLKGERMNKLKMFWEGTTPKVRMVLIICVALAVTIIVTVLGCALIYTEQVVPVIEAVGKK